MTYRNVRQARTADQIEARKRIQRGAHNLVLLTQGDSTTREMGAVAAKATHWWEDLRRGRLSVYGALFRFIDISVARGVPRSVVERIPRVIDWYIADSYDPTNTGEIKLESLDLPHAA